MGRAVGGRSVALARLGLDRYGESGRDRGSSRWYGEVRKVRVWSGPARLWGLVRSGLASRGGTDRSVVLCAVAMERRGSVGHGLGRHVGTERQVVVLDGSDRKVTVGGIEAYLVRPVTMLIPELGCRRGLVRIVTMWLVGCRWGLSQWNG